MCAVERIEDSEYAGNYTGIDYMLVSYRRFVYIHIIAKLFPAYCLQRTVNKCQAFNWSIQNAGNLRHPAGHADLRRSMLLNYPERKITQSGKL